MLHVINTVEIWFNFCFLIFTYTNEEAKQRKYHDEII